MPPPSIPFYKMHRHFSLTVTCRHSMQKIDNSRVDVSNSLFWIWSVFFTVTFSVFTPPVDLGRWQCSLLNHGGWRWWRSKLFTGQEYNETRLRRTVTHKILSAGGCVLLGCWEWVGHTLHIMIKDQHRFHCYTALMWWWRLLYLTCPRNPLISIIWRTSCASASIY